MELDLLVALESANTAHEQAIETTLNILDHPERWIQSDFQFLNVPEYFDFLLSEIPSIKVDLEKSL